MVRVRRRRHRPPFSALRTAAGSFVVALVLGAAPGMAACSGGAPGTDSTAVDGAPGAPALDGRLTAVSFTDVQLTDEFWRPRMEINQRVTIPHIMRMNEESGRIDNFRRAAGLVEGPFQGRRYDDTDVYKAIEAASYVLAHEFDPELDRRLDDLITTIAAAQEDDGYLFPAWSVDPEHPAEGVSTVRWDRTNSNSHELYNAGHLIEAAVAHHQATGKRSLLDVAIRFADHVDGEFGANGRHNVPGHEEIELALVKLADVTGEERYLDLAKFFLDERGTEHDLADDPAADEYSRYDVPIYRQDHLPVGEQSEAVGHSVRAMYLYTGMADVLARTDAPGYQDALDRLWDDVSAAKMYLTGGIGAQGSFESFGDAYELPNDSAYAETCAAIGYDLWNWRMFLATGDARYVDVMERILYNGFLSGVSLKGDTFFYTNPLQSDGEHSRSEYFGTACCPGNLARLMAQLPGFVYASRGEALYVNLFIGSEGELEAPGGGALRVMQETRYPWDGAVKLIVEPEAETTIDLRIRIPGWARGEPVPSDLYRFADTGAGDTVPALRVNGESVALELDDGFAVIRRTWAAGDTVEIDLPMPVRRVAAHADVVENAGRLAIQRGPVVYAVEAIDHGGIALDLALAADAGFATEHREDMLGGVTVVTGTAMRGAEPVELLAVPYFAWANRGPGEMAVWLPQAQ